MKRIKVIKIKERLINKPLIQIIPPFGILYTLLFFTSLLSCSDFVEVDPPKNILISETVFSNRGTVESAMANIFYELREKGMVSGSFGVMTALSIYSDEMDYYGTNSNYAELYLHDVTSSNRVLLGWWTHAFSLIYSVNDIIQGVKASEGLTKDEKDRFMGQALFVRAYIHSILVSLFGDVPYISTTDYVKNNRVSRLSSQEVYTKVIDDLVLAVKLLEDQDELTSERILPDHNAAKALLSRMYLYTKNWELAEEMSSKLIGSFDLEMDLDRVFLKESQGTIWQIKPGEDPRNTQEANQLIIQSIPGQTYALTDEFLRAFEPGDQRFVHWVDSLQDPNNRTTLYYAHKYKARFKELESLEYSIVFRLAEQFLIRAEARAHLENNSGALADLNRIRNRAELNDISFDSQNDLLDAILQERRVELFTERGHRWFDLKRMDRADEILGTLKTGWKLTDMLFPIPENELEMNPNLLPQNPGY